MYRKILTCPLTGVEFEVAVNEPDLVPFAKATTHHPLLHEPVDMYVNERFELCIPLKHFAHIETLTRAEAAELLGVSRQRITQILSENIIDSHIVNNSVLFKKEDIIDYMNGRKIGRPRKEE